ncbi:hypothetical protein WEI85_31230 [Actinomycetes bacterium KLBMP 9797]
MADAGWRWSDAWIFVSVVIGGGAGRHLRAANTRRPEGVALADLLATAAHLNEVIPTRDDIEIAVHRLVGAGLVRVTDGFLGLTPAGERLWRGRPRRALETAVDGIHGVLNRSVPPGDASWSLSEQDYAAAVREYTVRYLAP